MDDIIAVEITLTSGETRYFMTWGRVQSRGDRGPVASLVLSLAARSHRDNVVSARVCERLAEAADAPYFFEALFDFARKPYPADWTAWTAERDAAMREGHDIYYLGAPADSRSKAPDAVWRDGGPWATGNDKSAGPSVGP